MPILRSEPEMTWRCDRCTTVTTTTWDDEAEEEIGLPALMNDQGQTYCDTCYEVQHGSRPYEPE